MIFVFRTARSALVRAVIFFLLVLLSGLVPAVVRADVVPAPVAEAGPTLHFDYGQGEGRGDAAAEFMYFVPLISPEPVSLATSPGNTQRARVTSLTRQASGHSFFVTCHFEFAGSGYQKNVIDQSENIRRHEKKLKAGGVLDRLLESINLEGTGSGSIEVEGSVAEGQETVNEVRLRFNSRGQASPVTICLRDVRYLNGALHAENELVARVNTLTFRRKPGPPKMEVTVASVKSKDAGNGFWQNLKGSIKGAAVNLLIEPLAVDPVGHQAMLDFGRALASRAATFTFPRAKHLQVGKPAS